MIDSTIKTEDEAKLFLLMYVRRAAEHSLEAAQFVGSDAQADDAGDELALSAVTTGFIMGMEFAFAVPEYARALHGLLPQHGVEREANIARRAADLFPVEASC